MLAGRYLAAATIATYPSLAGDRVVTMRMVVITGVIVIARAGIASCGELLLIFPVGMEITRAKVMQIAPEKGVQQHRRHGQKVARDTHA
jgi:hypothetical protein